MHGKGLGTCARKLVAEISTIKSMDVVLPVKRGQTRAEWTIRTVARPEKRVAQLLIQLGLQLPGRHRIIQTIHSPGAGSEMECRKTAPPAPPSRWDHEKLTPELRNLGCQCG